MLVEAQQMQQQQASVLPSTSYHQNQSTAAQSHQRPMAGQQIRLSVVRGPPTGAHSGAPGVQLQYQRGQIQLQQQMAQQQYHYHQIQQSPVRATAEAISGIGAYYEI